MHARKALCLCFEGKRYYPRQATKESIARVTEAQARTNNARAYPLTAKSIETVRIWLVSFAQLSIPSPPFPSWLTRENGLGPAFLRVQHTDNTYTRVFLPLQHTHVCTQRDRVSHALYPIVYLVTTGLSCTGIDESMLIASR